MTNILSCQICTLVIDQVMQLFKKNLSEYGQQTDLLFILFFITTRIVFSLCFSNHIALEKKSSPMLKESRCFS